MYMMTIQAAKQYRTSFEMRYCSIVCIAYNSDIFRRGAAEARLIGPVKCRIVVESAAGADITGRFMVADHRSSRQQPFDGHIPPNRRSGGAGEDPIDLRAAEKET